MTDRELLELAAKAAGIALEVDMNWGTGGMPFFRLAGEKWNPLTSDGDSLRLAVKLLLTVQQRDDHVKVGWAGCVQWVGEDCLPCDAEHRPAATRRAIVRAAAEIGKTKP